MDIAVVIPVYNRIAKIRAAVESVLGQSYEPSEVMVVDDGSADNPEKALMKIGDPRLKILRQENKGVSAARNLGIINSKSEWIAFLDSDDWWLSGKLEKQVTFHKANGHLLISQTDEKWIRNGAFVNPKKYHRKVAGDIFSESLERCMVSPSAVLMHRSLFDKIGLFDEELPACEDYDLWLRITCEHEVGLVDEKLIVKTGGHDDQLSQKYWGMDRFRIKSLEKLISGKTLNNEQEEAVINKLIEKCDILAAGAAKRGRQNEAADYGYLRDKYIKLYERTGR